MEYLNVHFLHPIPLNAFLCDISDLTKTVNTASYADDNAIYIIGNNQYEVEKEVASAKLFVKTA